MSFLYQTLNILIDLLYVLIIVRVLMSWFVEHPNRHLISRLVYEWTEPMLKPLRRALPRLGPLDLSPLVAILALELLRTLIHILL